ncbi:unnamed protein product [Phytophthora fragariaefolia]|uniref:Unnamed protein product n=1 Tax=Phytophthora fragariaefolia TaxID=1490495 RepID=A0A9W7D5Z2_9STRA|nr:unnamed protein product [Phytophthora fragariaefolia]
MVGNSAARCCLLRLLVIAGTTLGVALVVLAVVRARSRSHRVLSELDGRERNLQDARYAMPVGLSEARFRGEGHHEWSSDDRRKHEKSHDHHHHHHHNDDDDSKDEGSDDDGGDGSSKAGSGGNNETDSAAIQSSVVTNMDGVNIGNTITIINIGIGSQGSSSGSAGNLWSGKVSGDHNAVSDGGRSAVTAAAVRAFCDSFGCSPSNSTEAPSTMPELKRNPVAGNEARYELPPAKIVNSAVALRHVRWLVLIAIVVQLR